MGRGRKRFDWSKRGHSYHRPAYNKPEKEDTFVFGRWRILETGNPPYYVMKHCSSKQVYAKEDMLICSECGAFTRDAAAFSMFNLIGCRAEDRQTPPLWVDNPGSKRPKHHKMREQAKRYLVTRGYSDINAVDIDALARAFQDVAGEAVYSYKKKMRAKREKRRYKRGRD